MKEPLWAVFFSYTIVGFLVLSWAYFFIGIPVWWFYFR